MLIAIIGVLAKYFSASEGFKKMGCLLKNLSVLFLGMCYIKIGYDK